MSASKQSVNITIHNLNNAEVKCLSDCLWVFTFVGYSDGVNLPAQEAPPVTTCNPVEHAVHVPTAEQVTQFVTPHAENKQGYILF